MIDGPVDAPEITTAWLALLDPDPVRAEACYLDLYRQLKRFLEWDCRDAEDAAQEVLTRGFRRMTEGADVSEKGPRAFFFGIARNVIREGWKPKHRREQQLDPPAWDAQMSPTAEATRTEARLELEQCLSRLDKNDADLIVRYAVDGSETLARELGISAETLRVRVFRIRARLRAIRDVEEAKSRRFSATAAKRRLGSRHERTGAEPVRGEP